MQLNYTSVSPVKEIIQLLNLCKFAVHLTWRFTESDLLTFILPNTVFGLSGFFFLDDEEIFTQKFVLNIWVRILLVLLFNWSNTLIFNISNQRAPKAVQEDAINKPSRPLPSKMITSEQADVLQIILIPTVLFMSFLLGVWKQTAILIVLNWVYNDLEFSDNLARNVVIAMAFAFYYDGSYTIAVQRPMTIHGWTWALYLCGIIVTTMQAQDFKDQAGDLLRGRKTLPLAMGDRCCRWVTSIFIVMWTVICTQYWISSLLVTVASTTFALALAGRLVLMDGFKADKQSWKLWSLWMATMYTLPVVRWCM